MQIWLSMHIWSNLFIFTRKEDVGLNVNKVKKLEKYVGRHESLNLGSRDDTNESNVEEMISEEENEAL